MVESFLEEWPAELLERGKDRYLPNLGIRIMQATYNHPWGKRRGGNRTFPRNPWAEVEFFSVEKTAKYVPSHEIINKVVMAADPEEKVLIIFLRDTGARINEALNCQWYDVSIPNQTVTLFTRKKKDGSLTPRRLKLSEELKDLLASWRKRNQDKTFVFENPETGQGYKYRWTADRQRKICKRANVRYFTLHSYRHYFASKLIQDGADLVKVQRLLGHESATTTNRYLHDLGVLE